MLWVLYVFLFLVGAVCIIGGNLPRLGRGFLALYEIRLLKTSHSLLPCRHAVSIIPVVMNLMRAYGAPMASRRSYITPTNA